MPATINSRNGGAKKRDQDSYFALVLQFPLKSIQNDRQLKDASAFLDTLISRELDEDELDYVEVLGGLIHCYEKEHHPPADVSQAEVLEMLMSANGLNQASLAKRVGISASTISDILRGKRQLTVEHMEKLGEEFAISPAVFMKRRG